MTTDESFRHGMKYSIDAKAKGKDISKMDQHKHDEKAPSQWLIGGNSRAPISNLPFLSNCNKDGAYDRIAISMTKMW